MEQTDERTYALFAPVRVSPPFYGWVFQFGGGVRILAPDDVREQMLLMLEAARLAGCATRAEDGADDGGADFVSYRTRRT
jgi:predicted DNA-binding transcriptional regulator YafY